MGADSVASARLGLPNRLAAVAGGCGDAAGVWAALSAGRLSAAPGPPAPPDGAALRTAFRVMELVALCWGVAPLGDSGLGAGAVATVLVTSGFAATASRVVVSLASLPAVASVLPALSFAAASFCSSSSPLLVLLMAGGSAVSGRGVTATGRFTPPWLEEKNFITNDIF